MIRLRAVSYTHLDVYKRQDVLHEAEQRAHRTFTDAENRAQKVLAAAEDRMTQLKVERVAVARYFESLGEVVTNARKLEQSVKPSTCLLYTSRCV